MRQYFIFGYPGVLILEVPVLLQVAFTLLGKLNIQICDARLVLRCYNSVNDLIYRNRLKGENSCRRLLGCYVVTFFFINYNSASVSTL
jgi:hypothetical protein